ncbi:cytochrome P450 [Amycolatopsis minnesotensis]|uniref:Cytochrome P450 n=1 Tax=Amycolatopsis minnesotensis TaxID=337894 RepID=A0ABN2Q0H9_9PSEU
MAELTMKQIYTETGADDPYPLFRRIREADPVYWDPHMGDDGAWMVTGYAEAMSALMDTRLSAKRPHWNPAALPDDTDPGHRTALAALDDQVVVADPPEHTRLRRHLNRPFLPRPVHDMEDRITATARHLIDAALSGGTGEFDAMGDYGFTLPATSLGRVLGIPRDQDYIPWMLSLGLLIDDGPVSRERTPKLLGSVHEYLEFFRGQVAERRGGGYDDLMQTLADAYTNGEFADETELYANLAFLLTAGQISTAHQIGSTLLHLLRRPEIYERLRANPGLVPAVSPELMRYDASVQLTKRRVREPLRLGDHDLDTGAEIFVWIGAANRDPERFPDPDRLDPDRENVTHLSFGRGIHFCLGAQLGKLVHDTALQTFLDRVPNPRLLVDGRVHRSAMPTFRGPYLLPVGYR